MGGRQRLRFFSQGADRREAAQGQERASGPRVDVFTSWFGKLKFDEAVCWAFDVVPSRLRRLYWSVSFRALKSKLRLRSSFEQVRFSQEFQIMAEILSAAFSSGKDKQADNVNVLSPRNLTEAKSMLA